jgi:transposase
MTNTKLLSRLTRMKGFRVTWLELQETELRLYLGVKPYKTGCCCPHCGRRGIIVNRLPECRQWDDVIICGMRTILIYAPCEIKCPTHGRVQERIPWAETHTRISFRLEYLILVFCQIMTQKAAARLLHLPQSTLSDILHRTIERLRDGHRIGDIDKLGVDEISYCKGRKYATIVYDLERQCVVWIGAGKGRDAIDQFFRQITEEQRNKIRFASCDMSKAYIGAIEHWCPSAILVIDRFHIVKALNESVDEIRKEEWRAAQGDDKKTLKGLRWLLYMHSNTRSKADTRRLNELRKANRRIHRAWVLKDEFEAFWDYKCSVAAESFFKGWITAALRSRLKPMREFAFTLRRHALHILPFVKTHLTNAVSEGINRIIKIVKNRASGYANLPAFIDMIFLTVGDLDLPAQIAADFRIA